MVPDAQRCGTQTTALSAIHVSVAKRDLNHSLERDPCERSETGSKQKKGGPRAALFNSCQLEA